MEALGRTQVPWRHRADWHTHKDVKDCWKRVGVGAGGRNDSNNVRTCE
jgi:hypothetical protein